MNILGVIPARFASTRYPGKPLISIAGKTMIRRVWERASLAESLADLVVATDDDRIADEVISFGGNVIKTSPEHPTGTDRCREALEMAELAKRVRYDAVINIQGDEPFIHPEQIDLTASCFAEPETQLSTLKKKLTKTEDLFNPNIIKVVTSVHDHALYFSRSPIPHMRGKEQEKWITEGSFFKHIGIYGYRSDVLRAITQLSPSLLETAESLEQLRWLENGFQIKVKETDKESRSIDSPSDLNLILSELNEDGKD